MAALGELCRAHGLLLVEDAAQCIGATLDGRALGAIGDLGALSFHETKNVSCGEGGALLVNDERWAQRAEILQEKGTDRQRFARGEVDKYTWVDVGSSFLMSDVTAALLAEQLERVAQITAARLAIWDAYHAALEPLERAGALRRPVVPPGAGHNAHLYRIMLADLAARDAVIARARRRRDRRLLSLRPAALRAGRPALRPRARPDGRHRRGGRAAAAPAAVGRDDARATSRASPPGVAAAL